MVAICYHTTLHKINRNQSKHLYQFQKHLTLAIIMTQKSFQNHSIRKFWVKMILDLLLSPERFSSPSSTPNTQHFSHWINLAFSSKKNKTQKIAENKRWEVFSQHREISNLKEGPEQVNFSKKSAIKSTLSSWRRATETQGFPKPELWAT